MAPRTRRRTPPRPREQRPVIKDHRPTLRNAEHYLFKLVSELVDGLYSAAYSPAELVAVETALGVVTAMRLRAEVLHGV